MLSMYAFLQALIPYGIAGLAIGGLLTIAGGWGIWKHGRV